LNRKFIWILSAFICISLVILGFNVYGKTKEKAEEKNMEHNNHHEGHGTNGVNEVTPEVSYTDGELVIEIKDKHDDIPELEVSHEKVMHLIVISSDLQDYHHLHPEKRSKSKYASKINLPDAHYKVFVDIAPKDLNYTVEPITLSIGETQKDSTKNKLVADSDFTKTINGQTVELITEKIEVDKEVTFRFDVKDVTPEPYLGALGHVVITDETGEKFIHVHPLSDDETNFATQFDESGMYKPWAEFKFGEHVNAYPFVIEVE